MIVPTFGQPEEGVKYEDRPGSYVFLKNEQGWFAVVRTSLGYFLPGGGAEGNETPEETLHREVYEEIGIKLTNLKKVGEAKQYTISRHYKQGFRKHGHFYTADWETDPKAQWQKDHSLEWLKPENLVEGLTHEFQKWMAKKQVGQ